MKIKLIIPTPNPSGLAELKPFTMKPPNTSIKM